MGQSSLHCHSQDGQMLEQRWKLQTVPEKPIVCWKSFFFCKPPFRGGSWIAQEQRHARKTVQQLMGLGARILQQLLQLPEHSKINRQVCSFFDIQLAHLPMFPRWWSIRCHEYEQSEPNDENGGSGRKLQSDEIWKVLILATVVSNAFLPLGGSHRWSLSNHSFSDNHWWHVILCNWRQVIMLKINFSVLNCMIQCTPALTDFWETLEWTETDVAWERAETWNKEVVADCIPFRSNHHRTLIIAIMSWTSIGLVPDHASSHDFSDGSSDNYLKQIPFLLVYFRDFRPENKKYSINAQPKSKKRSSVPSDKRTTLFSLDNSKYGCVGRVAVT